MAAPNKIDDFVPYRLLLFVEASLAKISRAAGYNCDVFATDDYDEAEGSTAKHVIYYQVFNGSTPQHGVGNEGGGASVQQSMTVSIFGVSTYETEHPRRLNMALEQDVRTALHSEVINLRAAVGRGCSFRFESLEYDAGALAPVKEAGFELSVSFLWSQGSDW